MQILNLPEIRRALDYGAVIGRMRQALVAWSRGECEMPMPMHLAIGPENAEIHIKSSYRRGGKYFALKIASTFPGNPARGLPTGNGMLLLSSAETGATARWAFWALASRRGCRRNCMPRCSILSACGSGAARRGPKNARASCARLCLASRSRWRSRRPRWRARRA